MNAEMRRITPTEAWMAWENQIINGVFPLRRFLGSSDHSAVFLTEYKAHTLIEAAIKFVPTDSLRADAQLVQWGAAATVTHPHLVRLFDMGRFQFGGHGFLYVVMEYAEQTLAQVLPRRALTSDETRDMLRPTLDTLAFLHRNHLIHSRLKPANLLVVNDQLKLASDTIRPTGASSGRVVRTSVYDAPELRDGVVSTASDLWSLGVTLVEALTQRAPMWPDEHGETIVPIEEVPEPFAHTVRHCLSRTPSNRPSVEDLEAEYKPAPQAGTPAPAATDETQSEAATPPNPARPSLLAPAIVTALVIFVGIWFFTRSHITLPLSSPDQGSAAANEAPPPFPVATTPVEPAPAPTSFESQPVEQPAAPADASSSSPAVLHEVTPEIPQKTLNRIRGHVKVTVRVLVDPSGAVVGDLLEKAGPSNWFARKAREAASDWKFTPVDDKGSRVWLLHFDFSRSGVTVDSTFVQ